MNNLETTNVPPLNKLEPGTWGWWKSSAQAETEDIAHSVGLDQAMLLEFMNMFMNI